MSEVLAPTRRSVAGIVGPAATHTQGGLPVLGRLDRKVGGQGFIHGCGDGRPPDGHGGKRSTGQIPAGSNRSLCFRSSGLCLIELEVVLPEHEPELR